MSKRKFVESLGKHVRFPSDWSDDQIDEWISQQGGGETDVLGALKHGWKSGWADTADSYSDYKDAIIRLLPGMDDPKEDFLDRASGKLAASAGEAPDTLTEKIASGVGSIPASIIGLLPAVGASIAATGATGNPIAGTALGFGLHGAVREQDKEASDIFKGAAIGALEGGAFGKITSLS